VTRWVWLAVLGWGVGCTTPTEPEPALCDGESPSALTAPARFVLGEAAAYPSDPTIRTRADALETMIEWRLIEMIVRDADLYATDAEVDEILDRVGACLPTGVGG